MDGEEHTLRSPCPFRTPQKVEAEREVRVPGAPTCIIHQPALDRK